MTLQSKKKIRIEDFYVVDSDEGLIISTRGGNGERFFMLSSRAWAMLVKKIHDSFSTGADTIFFEMGQHYGAALAHQVKKYGLDYKQGIETLLERTAVVGWGKIIVSGNFESGEDIRVKVDNCVFCEDRKGTTSKPSCYFFRGIVSGMSQSLYQTSFRTVERLCVASGGPYCEFILEPDKFSVESIN